MATRSPTATVKKLARYCCRECGAKELYLYCWKGCRQIQNLKTFYSETKTVCEELETLKATVYAQELRLRDADALMTEKQHSLDLLMDEVKRLPQLRGSTALPSASAGPGKHKLPAWAKLGVGLIVKKFDGNSDGRLNTDELATFSAAMKNANARVDVSAMLHSTDKHFADTESILTYYDRAGATRLASDLQSLDIQFGTTQAIAAAVAESLGLLHGFAAQAKDLLHEVSTLKSEVNEKARATTRLREGFAEAKMALDGKDTEIQRVQQHRSHVDKELQSTKDTMASLSAELKKTVGELSARNTALHDLRALVEDQVHEKEKWQRYCWELEERLYDAVHTSHAKERDLWKTRDAKKEEARKNMLLYMDRGMGKKHYAQQQEDDGLLQRSVRPATTTDGLEDAQTDSSCCSDLGCLEGDVVLAS